MQFDGSFCFNYLLLKLLERFCLFFFGTEGINVRAEFKQTVV